MARGRTAQGPRKMWGVVVAHLILGVALAHLNLVVGWVVEIVASFLLKSKQMR